jgi:hypothetical protein
VKFIRFSLHFFQPYSIFVECGMQVPIVFDILGVTVDSCCRLPTLTNCSIFVVQITTYLLSEKITLLSTPHCRAASLCDYTCFLKGEGFVLVWLLHQLITVPF